MNHAAESPLTGIGVHFALISMMAIGNGVIMLAPDIHRYVVEANHWITTEQFAAAYTIAQAAPGPNMLYVTLVGWWVAGWAGAAVATLAIVLPPVALTLGLMHVSSRSGQPGRLGRALRTGLAPISVGLLFAGGWVLLHAAALSWRGGVLSLLTVAVMLRTRLNPLWLIATGAVAGVAGLV